MKYSNSERSTQGFAMVVALSLMAFVLLLLLSVSTLVRVETQVSESTRQRLLAQQNALLGAMLSLGDLQKLAGPDQRVTARSDLSNTGLPDGQARWTGIWSSKADLNDSLDVAVDLDQNQVQWLVSGAVADAAVAVDPNDSIELASLNRSVGLAAETVRVELEPILSAQGGESGKYGYWASDESLKARVNLGDSYVLSAQPQDAMFRASMAQQWDASLARDEQGAQTLLATGSVSYWKDGNLNFERVGASSDLSLLLELPASSAVPQGYFHDLSYQSRSLLVNVKDGGLKRDLSAALLNLPSDLQGPMFADAGGSSGVADPGGPKWEQLADFYALAAAGPAGATVNFRMPTNDQVGITPIVTRFNYVIQAYASPLAVPQVPSDVDDARNFQYTLGIFPQLTLWNPYDYDLVLPRIGLQCDLTGFSIVDRTDPDSELVELLSPADINYDNNQNRKMVGFTIESHTIPAGRAVNFSPPVNSIYTAQNPEVNRLKFGAGPLIRGFFTAPVTPSLTAPAMPFTHWGDFSNLSFKQSDEVWQQVVSLYDLSGVDGADADLTDDRRFWSSAEQGGWSKRFCDPDKNLSSRMRVIALSAIGESDFGFLQPAGASVSASMDANNSSFELVDIRTYASRIGGYAMMLNLPKSNVDSQNRIQVLNQFNLRSPISFNTYHSLLNEASGSGEDHIKGYKLYTRGAERDWIGSMEPNFKDGAYDNYSKIGLSNKTAEGSDYSILFELPRKEPLGIGQLMHANLSHVDRISHVVTASGFYTNQQQAHTAPSYPIGNSAANVHLPLSLTQLNFDAANVGDAFSGSFSKPGSAEARGSIYDTSYLLNDRLWDGFFFSTIHADNRGGSLQWPLPNTRLSAKSDGFDEVDVLLERRAAAELLLNGGFNVNSTSLAAWESVLGAMRDVDTLGSASVADAELRNNFARFLEPFLNSTAVDPSYDSAPDRNAIAAGFRSLSDAQVSDLADAIVDELKARRIAQGRPFKSLSEFINRSIDTDDIAAPNRRRFAYQGLLQSAIDQSGINGTPAFDADGSTQTADGLWEDDYASNVSEDWPSQGAFLPESLASLEGRPLFEGAAGFLTQADLLSKIGSALTVRGDTFKIRAYGRADQIENQAEAYCELTVQRLPDFIDATDEAYDPASTRLNQGFGRRFEIVSFRWLSADEI